MIVKLLTEHHLKFLSLKGSCIGSSESTLVKMSNCWKSHAAAHFKLSKCDDTAVSSFLNQKQIKIEPCHVISNNVAF